MKGTIKEEIFFKGTRAPKTIIIIIIKGDRGFYFVQEQEDIDQKQQEGNTL